MVWIWIYTRQGLIDYIQSVSMPAFTRCTNYVTADQLLKLCVCVHTALDDVRVPLFSDDESVDFQPPRSDFALVERVQQVFLHGFDFTIRDEEDVCVFPLFGV